MLVIAHRGYSGKFLENSKEAFEQAIKFKCKALELDVHLALDNELIVTHDFNLGRTVKANGTVIDFTSKELEGYGVMTLKKVLAVVDHQCLINVEIKTETLLSPEAYSKMTSKLLEIAEPYGLNDVLFSSFDGYALKHLRSKSEQARIALLDDQADRGPRIAEAKSLKAEAYNVNLKKITRQQVTLLQEAGFKVFAYTVKNHADLELAKGLALDGIFADNLEEAQSF